MKTKSNPKMITDRNLYSMSKKHENSMSIRCLSFTRMQSGEESKDVIKTRPVIALSMRDINEDTMENIIDWMSVQTTERSHSSSSAYNFYGHLDLSVKHEIMLHMGAIPKKILGNTSYPTSDLDKRQ